MHPPRSLQQSLVGVVAAQVQQGGQLGLDEHHNVGLLAADQRVQVPLLLLRVDAPDVPHEHREVHWGGGEVSVGWLGAPLGGAVGAR